MFLTLSAELKQMQTLITVGLFLFLSLWETLFPHFYFYHKGEGPKRLGHLLKNFALGGINIALGAGVFVSLWILAAAWSRDQQFGLLYQFGLSPEVHALLTLLILDFWTYWWHRINHKWPFLWRFHHVHHSDPAMDVSTSYRFHVGELFLSHSIRLLLIPLLGFHLWEVILFDLILFTNVQVHHANIHFPDKVDTFLRFFIVTPAMHKVHHSDKPREMHSNFTAVLSIWDRLFGSFYMSQKPEDIQFGIKGLKDPDQQRLGSLLKAPIYIPNTAEKLDK